MRIIAGIAGGIPLRVPHSLTRPTTDRVREAVFSSLADRVPGARVLDLYAGSGALGLEALSRGADHVTFVDRAGASCDVIRENLKKARLNGAEVLCRPVRGFLASLGPASLVQPRTGADIAAAAGQQMPEESSAREAASAFDLVFADPPYARDDESASEIDQLLGDDHLLQALRPEGLLIFESLASSQLPELVDKRFVTLREKRYGDTRVSFLRRKETVAS